MPRSGYRRVIGGVGVAVDVVGCHLEPATGDELGPFTYPMAEGAVDIAFQVHCGDAPPVPTHAPIFQTDAWAMWPLPDGGFLVSLLRARVDERPTLVSDRRTTVVRYHEAEPYVPLVNGIRLVTDPFRNPLDQMLFVQHLAYRQGAIIHSSGIAFGEAGVIFPGMSGAGKSTLTGLLTSAFPSARALSDERVIVRGRGDGFDVWGTPWMGTARVARNDKAPLRALVFLEQHAGHGIRSITPKEAVRRLFGVLACPLYDPERSVLVLETMERLVASVPAYVLRFARDPGVGRVLEDFLLRELGVAVA